MTGQSIRRFDPSVRSLVRLLDWFLWGSNLHTVQAHYHGQNPAYAANLRAPPPLLSAKWKIATLPPRSHTQAIARHNKEERHAS
jgi:hypothetical protein